MPAGTAAGAKIQSEPHASATGNALLASTLLAVEPAPAFAQAARLVVIKADGLQYDMVDEMVREKNPRTGKSVLPWIEHIFYNEMPVRFGFAHRPSPRDDQIITTSFTIGGGVPIGPLRADGAVEIANRQYRFPDVFDDAEFGGTTHATEDLVEENATFFYVTLSTELDPFGG